MAAKDTKVLNDLQQEVSKLTSEIKKLDGLDKDLKRIERTIEKIQSKIEELQFTLRSEMKDDYVNNDKFEPVKLVVYGVVGLILVTVVSALLALVVPQIENNFVHTKFTVIEKTQ